MEKFKFGEHLAPRKTNWFTRLLPKIDDYLWALSLVFVGILAVLALIIITYEFIGGSP